ncbi:MAG TPA: hypothetical protein VFS30_00675, partial [Dehalococcoidia bacterium]|nr:hypothetical protein [Dehalococcoidia bacterium]
VRWDSGLEILGELDWSEDYQWAVFTVWRDASEPKVLYYNRDSGCSCNSPHDEIKSRDELGVAYSASEMLAAIDREDWGWDASDLKEKVRQHYRAKETPTA